MSQPGGGGGGGLHCLLYSLVSLVHRIFQVHSFQHWTHPRKQRIVYNKPTTKQKSKNKENLFRLSHLYTGDEPNIACVDTCNTVTYNMRRLYHVTHKTYELHRKTDRADNPQSTGHKILGEGLVYDRGGDARRLT